MTVIHIDQNLDNLNRGSKKSHRSCQAKKKSLRLSMPAIVLMFQSFGILPFDAATKKSEANAVLCHGCGTCVAACPADAIKGNDFSNEEIMAGIRGVLA